MANFHNSQQTQLSHNDLTVISRATGCCMATGSKVQCGRLQDAKYIVGGMAHLGNAQQRRACRLVETCGDSSALYSQPDGNMSKMFFTRTTQLRTGLTACCALYSQRHSTTRKTNAFCDVFGYNLPNWSKTFSLP